MVEQILDEIENLYKEYKEKYEEHKKLYDKVRNEITSRVQKIVKRLHNVDVDNFWVEFNSYKFNLESLRFREVLNYGTPAEYSIFDDYKVLKLFAENLNEIIQTLLNKIHTELSTRVSRLNNNIKILREIEKVLER